MNLSEEYDFFLNAPEDIVDQYIHEQLNHKERLDNSMGLSILLHGGPGTGKSTLSATAPGPRLLIDTEGGGEWTSGKVITWTELGTLPAGIDADTTVVVSVTNISTFQTLYQWLMSGKHPFNSVILDSVSEMQKRVIDSMAAIGTDPDWTVLLRTMEKMIRDLKDLKIHPVKPVEAVVFICGTQSKMTDKVAGPWTPMLTGNLANTISHYVDVCGFATLSFNPEDHTITQQLQIIPFNNITAKDRTSQQGKAGLSATFGPILVNPNISNLVQVANQSQAVA